MKLIILIIGLALTKTLLTVDSINESGLLKEIVQSDIFTISIQRNDLGYVNNEQKYHFVKSEQDILVSHEHLIKNLQDTSIYSAKLKNQVLDSIILLCSDIKSIQTDNPKKHNRKFNKSGVHDIILIYNDRDTIIISDVHSKAINEIPNMIKRNIY